MKAPFQGLLSRERLAPLWGAAGWTLGAEVG